MIPTSLKTPSKNSKEIAMSTNAGKIRSREPRTLLGAIFAIGLTGLALAIPGSASAAPVLGVGLSHVPAAVPVGTYAQYKIAVSNSGDAVTNAPIDVTFTLPAGMQATEVSSEKLGGPGGTSVWSCSIAAGFQSVGCTGPQPAGAPAPGQEVCQEFGFTCRIIVTVRTDPTLAPGALTPMVEACGGGSVACGSASDPTEIVPRAFKLRTFDGGVFTEVGNPVNQAGAHPDTGSTTFLLNEELHANGGEYATEAIKDVMVDLPPGFVGNPQVLGTCKHSDIVTPLFDDLPKCPPESQAGIITLHYNGSFSEPGIHKPISLPVYKMDPPKGTAALFAFNVSGSVVYISGSLRSGADYGIRTESLNAPQTIDIAGVTFTFWGVPSRESHDSDRGYRPFIGSCASSANPACTNASSAEDRPFISLPTSCNGPVETFLSVSGWEGGSDSASFISHDNTLPDPQPLAIEGCNNLEFDPTLKARPTTNVADSPTGLEVQLHVPQNEEPEGNATAHLRDATVTLPPGLVINPAGANGLDGCSSTQIGLTSASGVTPVTYTPAAAQCPDAAKIGTVQVDTPLLDHPVQGAVYIARPYDNPFDSLLAIYIALDDPETGVVVKLAGKVTADPQTGQLTTTVEDNPQLPFEDFKLNFFGGAAASLRTPATCGPYSTTSSLTPWSAPDSGLPATPSDTYSIDQGPGLPCAGNAASLPNAPSFDAGSVSPIAGAHSPFVVNLQRADGTQEFSSVTVTPPPGLVGKLAGIPYCPDSTLAAAAAKTGQAEKASSSCPLASRVGSVVAGAGAGPAPYYASGEAYLTGPYKGAPLSLAIITPAVAGPFDLGTIVIRTALHVNSRTAQITAVSDPLPRILQGIPLDVRSVHIKMDRPDFILNPTSCDPMAVGGQLIAVLNQAASLSSRFQVGECGRLGFKPRISLRLKGGTARDKYPALTAVLRPRAGDANISNVSVALPPSEFLAQEHIRTVCTRVQFAADQCPKATIYGYATVTTPLLDFPLTGPVYLRSSDNPLPDLVPDLRGLPHQPIRLESAGRTDSIRGGIRNTFDFVPDAPFTKLVLRMQGGRKGLLVNSGNICKKKYRARVKFGAHNGMKASSRPVLKVNCQRKGGKGKGDGKRGNRRSSRASG